MIFEVLSYIGEKLNDNGVTWAVGASILLSHYGLIENPNDIDILVDLNDIEKVDKILKSIGEKKVRDKSDTYSTKYFYEYVVHGFDIDVMAGLSINYNSGTFEYIFDHISISEFKKINGVNIPLSSLEDWYVLYQLIPSREIKVKMIENYLLSNVIKRPDLLERALSGDLAEEVRDKIQEMLKF
ncbi:nucleotidyltransferase family protein [Clostridium estertheticum]|uniref:nucleotidyltransferase family protein n=1 Tax=Clostridium estertheticum TaxID=238834 RepID=UPI0013E951A3|nr:nucleotidyltransferase family protein [Clostridium estertheticum]MBZ9686202.1 nucleotidyltransferase family protein [Clostridium estertheticum]